MKNENILKTIIACISTFFCTVTEALSLPVTILISFMIADVLTGICKAIYNKNLGSSNMYHGLAKKMGIMIILIIACLLDSMLNTQNYMFRNLTCFFYSAQEGISICENLIQVGVKIPKFIQDVLIQVRNEADNGQTNEDVIKDIDSEKKSNLNTK